MCKKEIMGLTLEELQKELAGLGMKKFRAEQVFRWLYEKAATDFSQMSNLSKEARQQLEERYTIATSQVKVLKEYKSRDGLTHKVLLELTDGATVETVLMHHDYGYSVCLSSQVGCAMNCAFCASGLHGFVRNLTAAEILAQLYFFQSGLQPRGERVSRIVVMGSGEPMLNLDHVLKALDIPRCILPRVTDSSEVYGTTDLCGVQIPVAGIAGDQQAALFGQSCFGKGEAKNTYGTGCFLLMNTGDTICRSRNGLISTIAISLNGKVEYALEGSVFVGGAVIQWVRDGLRMIQESRDAEYYAQKVPDNGGIYIVPAFTGLGAPYWDMYARGAIVGITRGTTQNHIIRAAEESIAYQSADLVAAMEKDTGVPITSLKVDGGASRDQFLMQFQADILNKTVLRPAIRETTALGAAYLAGLATGVWKDRDEIRSLWHCNMTFAPQMDETERTRLLSGWHKAVGRSCDWAEH